MLSWTIKQLVLERISHDEVCKQTLFAIRIYHDLFTNSMKQNADGHTSRSSGMTNTISTTHYWKNKKKRSAKEMIKRQHQGLDKS